ncbi:MAG: avidin/streptavidin family protein [Pseudomonadales bacterium]
MKKLLFVLFSSAVYSAGGMAAPSCEDVKGAWVNQIGSLLTISKVTSEGRLSGTYRSSSGTDGESFPLIGWTNHAPAKQNTDNARVVSFSVNWGSNGSVTSWSGVCAVKKGTPTISTLWHLTRSNSQYDWDHTHTNKAVFTPK